MGKYVIAKATKGFKFLLVANNGQVLATSQVYSNKASCKNGIETVKGLVDSPIENQTVKNFTVEKKPKFEIYEDSKKEFRFRLIASNGKKIIGGDGYSTVDNCKEGINTLKNNVDSVIEDPTGEKKPAAKKPAAKKATAKKPAKKTAAKKPAAKKPAAKKAAEKKPAKKAAAKKPATKKPAAKKPAAKKPAAKKAATKK